MQGVLVVECTISSMLYPSLQPQLGWELLLLLRRHAD